MKLFGFKPKRDSEATKLAAEYVEERLKASKNYAQTRLNLETMRHTK